MKKLTYVIVILCLIPAIILALISCNNGKEVTVSDFEKAITDLGGYSLTTKVEAENGPTATLTEKVSISGDVVTVEYTKTVPNPIGSATQYTSSTETKTYSLENFAKFVLKLSEATNVEIGEDGAFCGTFPAEMAKDACGIDANYSSDVSVQVFLDANRRLQKAELSYKTTDGNTVSITVAP